MLMLIWKNDTDIDKFFAETSDQKFQLLKEDFTFNWGSWAAHLAGTGVIS